MGLSSAVLIYPLIKLVKKEVITAPNIVRKVNCCLHTVAPSSIANNTPPKGAIKAAATPKALPITAKSRFHSELRKCLFSQLGVRYPHTPDAPCEMPDPIIAPTWIMGPSLPAIRPEPIEKAHPTAFATAVGMANKPFKWTPFKYDLTSGIPEPSAIGAWNTTRNADKHANMALEKANVRKPAVKCHGERSPRCGDMKRLSETP